jgi:hypothetical protein
MKGATKMSTIRFRESGRVALCAALMMGIQLLPLAALSAPQAAISGVNSDGSVPRDFLKSATPHMSAKGAKGLDGKSGKFNAAASTGVPGIDSLTNWVGQFTAPGFDPNGNPQSVWPFSMVGHSPQSGISTTIRAPIIPVVVDLLDAKGNIAVSSTGAKLSDNPASILRPLLKSPIFASFQYYSGFTQFTDAQQRAQFWNIISGGDDENDGGNGWHTLLNPEVKTARHMRIPKGEYVYAVNADGSCCAFIEIDINTFSNLLFPPTFPVDNSTPIGAAELAGDMTTHDITSLIFKDVYLYQNGLPADCCVIGFHSYDFEPGIPSNGNLPREYVMMYASWISNGLFNGGFQDITAYSHEMAETFNDPFVDNVTPWWLSVDAFTGNGNCQDNLEVGDVVEVLSTTPTFAVQLNGQTYHPQNVADFSWFAFDSPSKAQHQAYSFPDETTLPALSPANLLPGCVPAP